MKIRWTGKARARVEGIGVFEPGQERDVPERVGNDLVGGGEFQKTGRRHPSTGSGTGTAAQRVKTKRQINKSAGMPVGQED